MKHSYLDELNESQRAAVLYDDGPALVIAGAGSGKTRVLVYKLLHLLEQGYRPHQLMALTFTNKAAREMTERVAASVGIEVAARIRMGTFHSIFSKILRRHADLLGFTSDYTIYDTSDSKTLLKKLLKQMQLDDKVYRINAIQSRISMAKNQLITVEAYCSNTELAKYDAKCRMPRMGELYALYAATCAQNNAMDFDDLLFKTNVLFRDYPEVLEKYQLGLGYLLIDEYQDTNLAQYVIAKQLMEKKGNLFVVGDDAQSIYSFRGANLKNILRFTSYFPTAKLFKLEENYRSTQSIVNAANSLIKHNKDQIFKNIFSNNSVGERIVVKSCLSGFLEAYTVATDIYERRVNKHDSYDDYAILYRTNAQSRPLEEALRKKNIPFRIYGGLSFYARKEIKDVLAYFRLIANDQDSEAFNRVVNYPKRGIGDTTVQRLNAYANSVGLSLWNVVSNLQNHKIESLSKGALAKLEAFKDLISEFKQRNYPSLYEQAQDILKRSGISNEIFTDKTLEGISKQENIKELLSAIEEFESSRREESEEQVTLGMFLSEVVLLTDQDIDQESNLSGQVSLMTVHAAKGLEFKHVYIVGLEENLFPSQMNSSIESLEEERRLFYVAITRAMQSCQLSFAAERMRNGQTEFCQPSRFIAEIDKSFLNFSHTKEFHQQREGDILPQNFDRSTQSNALPQWKPQSKRRVLISSQQINAVEPEQQHQSIGELFVGARVSHPRFGLGTIQLLEGEGENAKASVDFELVGVKKLVLRFSKLQLIK